MSKPERRWAWHAPGGPWSAAGALVAAAAGAVALATTSASPGVGVVLLVVMVGLILGVTPFGVAPPSRAPVRVGRFAFAAGATVLLAALVAGPLPPGPGAVFGLGMGLAVVVAAELTDVLVRVLSPTRR